MRALSRRGFAVQAQQGARRVNSVFQSKLRPMPALTARDNREGVLDAAKHGKDSWTKAEIDRELEDHCLMAWGPTDAMRDMTIRVSHGEGCYLFDMDGKKYLDFSSQAVCTNLGHTVPESVRNAISNQLDEVPMLYGGICVVEARARLCSLMAELAPGDINGFLFPSSGAEANEAAIRIARRFTGRHKVFSRARSYHGGTLGALSLTGDNRGRMVDTGVTGFVKMADPFPELFAWGEDQDTIAERCLQAVHEQFLSEDPSTVAAVIVESITGTNGWLKPSAKYMQGLRALCDQYGALLICDEVMAGFGRTGKLFAFQHFDGVVPDIVTFAKGVTGAYLPMSGVGIRQNILDHFRDVPLGYGSTYQAHPVAAACAYATIQYLLDNDLVAHAASMQPVFEREMDQLLAETPHALHCRMHGMAGGIDIGDGEGELLCGVSEQHPKALELRKAFLQNGLSTMIRGSFVHTTPPLIAGEAEIKEGMGIIRKSFQQVFH